MAGFYAQTIFVGPTTSVQQYLYDTTTGGAGPFIVGNLIRDIGGDTASVTAAGGVGADILSIGGTAVGATSYLPVRLTDGSAYLTGFPTNITQVAGSSVTAGAGAVAAGTIRTTLASDDPAVTSLAVVDDWDSQDQCKITLNNNPVQIAVTTSGAYAAGDVVGGIIEVTNANLASGRSVCVEKIQIVDKSANAVAMHLYGFRVTPSGGTYTDSAPLVWGSGDAASQEMSLSILAADWMTAAGQTSVMLQPECEIDLDGTSLFLLYFAPAGSAPSIASGNLKINVWLRQY